MEEKAAFGVKEALLCVVVSAALAAGGVAVYLAWNAKLKSEKVCSVEGDVEGEVLSVEGGALDAENEPMTMDQFPGALYAIQFLRANFKEDRKSVV